MFPRTREREERKEMMTEKEVIQQARNLLTDPSKWCQRFFAYDEEGGCRQGWSSHAVKWCSLGALQWAVGNSLEEEEKPNENFYKGMDPSKEDSFESPTPHEPSPFYRAWLRLDVEANKRFGSGIAWANDHLTHQDILDIYDGTLKTFSEEGGKNDLSLG